MNPIHIYPLDEESKHELQSIIYPFCKCLPSDEIVNGTLIITHSAFDGRIGLEMAEKLLKEASAKPH